MRKQYWFPYEEKYREEIEAKLAIDAYHTAPILSITILLMQAMMVILFLMKPGGPFVSARRTGYFSLYLLLFAITASFLIIRNRKKNVKGAIQLRIEMIYAMVLCWWACAITALDQIGGNGLIVFSYIMLGTAALTILNMQQSIVIFGSGFLLLNIILPLFPGGMHNLFSNLVNSFFIMMMSILIARRLYLARISAHYSNIIIQQQFAEIEAKNQQLREIAVIWKKCYSKSWQRWRNRRFQWLV